MLTLTLITVAEDIFNPKLDTATWTMLFKFRMASNFL